jgi:hypothetical protein
MVHDGVIFETLQVIPDDEVLLSAIKEEARKALRRAAWFKEYKRGQLVFKFDKFGRYNGVGIIVQD